MSPTPPRVVKSVANQRNAADLVQIAALALVLTGLAPTAASAADLIIPAADNGVVNAVINGHPARLRIDFDAPAVVLLNPGSATRLGLKPGFLKATAVVGPVNLRGNIVRTTVEIDKEGFSAWTIWFDRDYAAGVDGVVSPSILPFEAVSVRTSHVSNGAVVTVPVEVNPPGESRRGIFYRLKVGDNAVLAKFSLVKPTTMATAPAAELLSASFGGQLVGPPTDREIAYGVARPVRQMTLRSPVNIGDFKLAQLDVRAGAGGITRIPDKEAASDPDEVVVIARDKSKPQEAFMTIGRDHLESCAAVTFYPKNPRITFDCAQ